jgi:hypothetical protein
MEPITTTEITPENISPLAPASALNDFQLEAIKQAEEELEALRKETSNKKYLIDITKSEIATLKKFILEDAAWKFTECLGIVEIEKELTTAEKEGKLFSKALGVEAIYYYMSKVEGNGTSPSTPSSFKHVTEYIKVLKAITNGVERIKADNEKVNNAEFVLAARMEGIEPDSSING